MQEGWEGLLAHGERILWQGCPEARLRLEWSSPIQPFFFTLFAGFAIVWMLGASKGGTLFWAFGLPFLFIGLYQLIGVHFWKYYLRKNTVYSLSTQRAFIATAFPWRRKLESFAISASTPISLVDGSATSDIRFAEKVTRGRRADIVTPIGFEQIPDAQNVFYLMRQVQAGTA